LKEKQESDSRNKQKHARVSQNFFVIEKTRAILNYMRKLRVSLFDVIQEVIKTSSVQKN
jgi:hypothetical protein